MITGRLLIENSSSLPLPSVAGSWKLVDGKLYAQDDRGEWIVVGLEDGEVLTCTESIVAGQLVDIWFDGTGRRARSASIPLGRLARGIAMISTPAGGQTAVLTRVGSISHIDYLRDGDCYLGENGLIAFTTNPDRTQRIGLAVGQELVFDPDSRFTSFLGVSITALDATIGPKSTDTATIRIARTGDGLDLLTVDLNYDADRYSPPFPEPVSIPIGETFVDIELSTKEPRAIVLDLIDTDTLRVSKRGGIEAEVYFVLGYPNPDNGWYIPAGVDSYLDISVSSLAGFLTPPPGIATVQLYYTGNMDTIIDATVHVVDYPSGSGDLD